MYLITIALGKVINLIINLFHLGAGFTWPGHLALNIYPELLLKPNLYPSKGVLYISATNGKTTTTKLITHILRKHGFTVVSNESGANLLNGVATSLILATDFYGNATAEFGVFEVDEFTLPAMLKAHAPSVLLLLNLSRDQLDRYGETDIILEKWQEALKDLPSTTPVLMDKDQPQFKQLTAVIAAEKHYFDADAQALKATSLLGEFNARNLNAALLAVSLFGIEPQYALEILKDFSAAWGRGETISHGDILWKILLAKNPMSFNSNLETVSAEEPPKSALLFMLNDNIPDGRDVSWIYDISADNLRTASANRAIYISGTRAYDMAVRLNYAGVTVDENNIAIDTNAALLQMQKVPAIKKVIVLP